jgi:hypothetical protein
MAQWLGQFSGRTHETRVLDAEATLRRGVGALREANTAEERERLTKQVRNLSKRLLTARLQLLKSRIARASEQRMGGSPTPWADGIAALRAKESQIREKGINGVLQEFDAADITLVNVP